MRKYIKDRLFEYLKADHPELVSQFEEAQSPEYRKRLDELVLGLAKNINLPIAGNNTIHHPELGSWNN